MPPLSVAFRSPVYFAKARLSRRRIRAAIEVFESRVLLSSILVNTFADQTDPPDAATVSLRDAIALAAARPGADTIDVPAGHYALTQPAIEIDDSSGKLTLNAIGGAAVLDAGPAVVGASPRGVLNVGSGDVSMTDFVFTGGTGGIWVNNSSLGNISNFGTLTLIGCTVTHNSTVFDGNVQNNGTLTLIDSAIVNNSGGAIGSTGDASALMIVNSTISGNTSHGGIGGIVSYGPMTLQDSTVTNNDNGGIAFSPKDAGSLFRCANSIIAGNSRFGNGLHDLFDNGIVTSLGHNLIGDAVGSSGWIASDLVGNDFAPIDARLSPLGNYGGPTLTMVPLAGSPALGAGSMALLPQTGGNTDQRGLPRTTAGSLDIGAVQTQPPARIRIAAPTAQRVPPRKAVSVHVGSFSAPANSGPYVASIDWGDGSPITVLSLASTSRLGSRTHQFIASGRLTTSVSMTDRFGDLSNLASFAITVSSAAPAAFVVNTTADRTDPAGSKIVSLRDAIKLANQRQGPVSITFDSKVFASAQVISLRGSNLELGGNTFGLITITGPAAGVTISGNKANQVLQIDKGVIAHLANINLADGGYLTTTGGSPTSGGLFNNGDVTLTRSVVSNNRGFDGAIINTGRLAVADSIISDNATGETQGGGISNTGVLTVTQSTISGNTEVYSNGAGIYNQGVAAISDSTITGNQAFVGLYGETFLYGRGGGVYNTGNLTIANSTITANSSDIRGAGVENLGTLAILDSTITDNAITVGDGSNPAGGGIDNVRGAHLVIANSIVATNKSGPATADGADVTGAVSSMGHNLIGQTNGSSRWIATDLKGSKAHPLDPHLSPLDFNGGPTQTQFPLAGSPAIGAGAASLVPGNIATDQRGFDRIVNGIVDIGAVELHRSATLTVQPPAAQNVVAGDATSIRLGSFTRSGGRGPFQVIINWGDGSSNSYFSVNGPGSLGIFAHTFINTGSLTGSIVVRDVQGDISQPAFFSLTAAVHPPITLVVNTTKDQVDPAGSKTVSLRDAFDLADQSFGPVTIRFDAGVFAAKQTVTLQTGSLALAHNIFGQVTVAGPAKGLRIVGNAANAVVSIANDAAASLSSLTISGGGQTGIVNNGTATLADCNISNNQGIYGGGIYNTGQLTITRCTIDDNTAEQLVRQNCSSSSAARAAASITPAAPPR